MTNVLSRPLQVWKAEADNICGYDGTVLVAVKAAKENAPQKEVSDLLQEMMIMQQIGPHPNVVTLLGVCVEQGELVGMVIAGNKM
jgi:hypothetical protein